MPRYNTDRLPTGPFSPSAAEWPTLVVVLCIYVSFGLLTYFHASLPWPIILVLGGYLVAWHGSLQHEVVHGHPTPWPWLNEALVLPSLWLWLPFRLYRASHLTHHRDEHITDPHRDPESWYLSRQRWQRMGTHRKRLQMLLNTSAGRLLLGPPMMVVQLMTATASAVRGGRLNWNAWLMHASGVGLVIAWVCGICDIPLHEYLLLYVYPGMGLTLLRSFAEHEAHPDPVRRTCAVHAHPVLALLFLNNNLHTVHHARPELPWYRLPECWRRQFAHGAGAPTVFNGYAQVLWRFAFRPRIAPSWPLERQPQAAPRR